MGSAFAKITFSASVKAAQTLYGSREQNRRLEQADGGLVELTEKEIAFIARRDSFYQATVSASGWPYVQHRGGPRGFLMVLDRQTLGYGDFRGNQQYLSVGNLA
jgi:predicted pyridoxine 5'-phosphate oxidase superfamily flavin-nucleotide-binding protein